MITLLLLTVIDRSQDNAMESMAAEKVQPPCDHARTVIREDQAAAAKRFQQDQRDASYPGFDSPKLVCKYMRNDTKSKMQETVQAHVATKYYFRATYCWISHWWRQRQQWTQRQHLVEQHRHRVQWH